MTVTPFPRIQIPATDEIGTSGLRRTSGIVTEEQLPALRGVQGRRVFAEMATDPVIAGFLFAIEKTLGRLEWRIDPGEESGEAQADAEFVEQCLDDMSQDWDSTLAEILSMGVFGWSYHEIVYKRRLGEKPSGPGKPASSKYSDGKLGWRKWAPRGQETLNQWLFDEDGGIQGMVQTDPFAGKGTVVIPIEKSLLFRTTSRRNSPEAVSLLRGAYRPWYFRKRIEEIEAIGVERDLAGLPVAWVPPQYLDPDAPDGVKAVLDEITSIVQSMKRNEKEGVVFPLAYDERGNKLFDLTLLSTGGTRNFDTDKIIGRYDQRIAMACLADWLLLGHENVGSFALGTAKMDMWTMAVDATAKSIAQVVNRYAIPRLFKLNGWKREVLPKLAYGDVAQVDLKEMADYIAKHVTAGVITPDDRLEAHARDIAGLPPAENETAHADAVAQAEDDRLAMQEQLAGGGQEEEQGAEDDSVGDSGTEAA